jgi:hypothetical protein
MCYSIYISTDAPEDFYDHNSELVRFERLSDSNNDQTTVRLEYQHKWYIGSKSGCSCSFRHLMSIELGFSDPVDWYNEEQDDIAATRELYSIFLKILSSGYHIDLIDSWQGAQPKDIKELDVSLSQVSNKAFRLFENHKFKLKK